MERWTRGAKILYYNGYEDGILPQLEKSGAPDGSECTNAEKTVPKHNSFNF